MLIDEHLDDDGELVRVSLQLDHSEGIVLSVNDQRVGSVPVRAVLIVMRRFGRELDDGIEPAGDSLELGEGRVLRELRFRAQVDVEPRNYLVLTGDGPPLAALSGGIAAALRHLASNPP